MEPERARYRRLEVEARYLRLRHSRQPVDYRGRSFDDFDLRSFLDEVLPKLRIAAAEPRAFEYGTGTGPGACYLAQRGFRVDAIDASPAAIQLARRFAAEKALSIDFAVADITHLPGAPRSYDLVVDNFCLHNLVTDDERGHALANVRELLNPEGYFVVGTSVFDPARSYGEDVRDERTGIVYRRLVENGDFEDVAYLDGTAYYPRVRHVRADALREELEAAGFRVLHQPKGGRLLCEMGRRLPRGRR